MHLAFWGKAQPHAHPPYPRSHPVAFHLLDVAATLDALLRVRPLALARAGALLGLPPEDARILLVTLAGLHDLGKFTPCFQAKALDRMPEALRRSPILPGLHTRDGLGLWRSRLRAWVPERIGLDAEDALDALAPAVFGHHGSPVDANRFDLRERFGAVGEAAALACAEAIVALLSPTKLEARISVERALAASWWVSGVMTVADWVGSGQRWFPYTSPNDDDATLSGYWEIAKARAAVAIREAGLTAPAPAPRRSFGRLVGLDGAPSPVQGWADTVELPEGPVLVVLEDVTGSGKTEAAHVLVHRLMVAGRASGAYWAMPSQATANAMYARQARLLEALFAPDAELRPSLVLAHGQQRLHGPFRTTVLDGAAAPGERSGERGDCEEELRASVSCAAFLADDRRAALLADVGAGTVDQALLGILSARFGTVRLFGLADHVLVVDEAHAYDAYMSEEIQGMLRFHAALGGCAVVLSATLSHLQRRALATAWREGLAAGGPYVPREALAADLASEAYPLATMVSPAGVVEAANGPAPWSRREVPVRLVHTLADAVAHVERCAAAGGCVVWIRNTVGDCLAAAALLRDRGIEKVMVFHARFAPCDRQLREEDVLRRFGKDSTAADRRGWVLVATQVVEQSLDLDFDAMVSDLAPIDLLIQRAGRLWRHPAREGERPSACACALVVLTPEPGDASVEGWTKGLFAGTAAVYRNAAVLWRTVQVLRRTGAIRTPEGLRPLIEAVYGEAADDPPPTFFPISQRAEGEELSHASAAQYAVLKVADGYCAGQQAWVNEVRVRTRLGEEQAPVRLARVRADGGIAPWSDEPVPWKAWALSEVRLRATRVPVGTTEPPEFAAAAKAVRQHWGRFEQEIPVLALAPDEAGVGRGTLLRPGGKSLAFRYTAEEGLAFDEPS